MQTATKLLLEHEVDETLACICGDVEKAKRDRFFPREAEITLRADLYDGWNAQLVTAYSRAQNFVASSGQMDQHMIPTLLHIFRHELAGVKLIRHITPRSSIADAIVAGKDQVTSNAKRTKASSFRSMIRKTNFFGLLFGITEQHALEALQEQLTISAGGFFDEQMTEVMRREIESWFAGEITREQFALKLKKLVNDRLSANGKDSLPRSYFDGLAEHYVVRARNFGSVFQAEKLGAVHYRIQGILDYRTSAICRGLITGGRVFELKGARAKMDDILKERNLSELKRKHPFLTEPGDAVNPIPPLHWRCRSWMEYIF